MTTEQYLDSIVTEYYDGSAWVNISAYVVSDIKGNNGLGGWKPDQRVAGLGILNITLNNKSKLFSPMGGDSIRGLSTLTGFNKGAKIRVVGTISGFSKTIWTGRITSIDSDDRNWGNEQARVMATGYMQVPVNYPMKGATIALNKQISEALTLILARLTIQPENTAFEIGLSTFPAVFDNVQRKTMALTEFTKLANSELGYIYDRQDGTLVAEGMLTREGWRALDQVWIMPDPNYLALEDGLGYLLLEDGGKLILEEGTLEDAAIHADMEEHNILIPEDALLNASIIRAHPVVTDTSLKVLYALGTPLFIPSGKTASFSAHYTDPSGLNQVSGTNMQTPVATTDYLANTASDGSGTNKTSDQVVTATYYGDTVYYSIANSATAGVWITFLQARGYGIYYGNSIESTKDDSISQELYGYAPFQFDMKYQKDTYLADMYGLSVIEEYKNPKSRITKVKYLANLNKNHMMSFLMLTIGSLVMLTEDRSGISNHYYITDRAFTIKQGGIIYCEYGVKQNDSYLSGGLNPVTVECAGGATNDGVNYGYLPQVSNAYLTRSLSAWIYLDSEPTTHAYAIMGPFADQEGALLAVGSALSYNRRLFYYQKGGYGAAAGVWATPTNSLSLSAWHHVVVTRDASNAANDPVIYIDGVAQTLTTYYAQGGATVSEIGVQFVIGNVKTASIDNTFPFDGKIFDARAYSRILTSAEVTTLYNSGTPDHTLVTNGLVFQGPAVYSDQGDDSSLAGTVLSSSDRLTENIIRAVGIPSGSPTLRANP